MKGKKGFMLYADQRGIFEKLNNEQAGNLIKHIFAYINDENPDGDFITELAFESIKQQLKRDLIKWEERADRSRLNGSLGGRPKKPKETQKTQRVNSKPRKPVNVNVNDNVNVNVNDNVNINKNPYIPEFLEFKNYALENANDLDLEALELKYKSWKVNGWKTGKDKKITNWKNTLLNTLKFLKKEKVAPKRKNFANDSDYD